MEKEKEYIKKCKDYMEKRGVSQAKLAAKIGVSESTFSRYLKDNYPNPESIEEKIASFFEKEEARSEASFTTDIDFAMTGISEIVLNVLEYARIQKIIGIIYGDAGVGKTYTCKQFLKERPDVIMITSSPAFASKRAFLKLLLYTLKSRHRGSVEDMALEIYSKFEGGDKMIIIDEAQHLTKEAIEMARNINDITKTAIVFVGNEVIYDKIKGGEQRGFAQFFSRASLKKGTFTDMFTEDDVKKIFLDLAEKKSLEYMLKICRSPYGLRGAVYIYNNAKNNKDLSLEGLKAMANLMGVGA